MTDTNILGRTTYSVEDDKLRFYPDEWLDREIYDLFKQVGFIWAAKQGCLVQVWSPAREDVCLKFSPEIEEETTTLEERAIDRSQRYNGYSGNAQGRATSARKTADQIANGRPLGQPILVGHHSQRRAERDQERIETSMHRFVIELEKAEYWQYRAQASLKYAARKHSPRKTLNRIKKLQTDRRKYKREIDNAATTSLEAAAHHYYYHDYTDLKQELTFREIMQLPEVIEQATFIAAKHIDHYKRWLKHVDMRLVYEKEIYDGCKIGLDKVVDEKEDIALEPGGAVYVLGWQPKRPCWCQIIRVNKSSATGEINSISVLPREGYYFGVKPPRRWKIEPASIKGVMSKEEVEAAGGVENIPEPARNDPPQPAPTMQSENEDISGQIALAKEELKSAQETEIVRGGPDYFATPPHIVEMMISEAWQNLPNDQQLTVLEPSAGDGRLLDAVKEMSPDHVCHFCELSYNAQQICVSKGYKFVAGDFMEYMISNTQLRYDLVLMNPPFSKGQDISHVMRAYQWLKPGGRLVAIMSEHGFIAHTHKGEAFREWLNDKDGFSEPLPPDTFKQSGTGVHTRIVVIDKPGMTQADKEFYMNETRVPDTEQLKLF